MNTHKWIIGIILSILFLTFSVTQATEVEGYSLFGMEVESASGDSNEIIVTTTGAAYVLTRTDINTTTIDMYRRIDPKTNEYDDSNDGKGQKVAQLSFYSDIGPLVIEVNRPAVAIIQSTKATFEFYSDSFFVITAKDGFTYTHTNLIENAPWNAPLEPNQRGLDRMWTDGYGGSLHAVMSQATAPAIGPNDVDYTMFNMTDGNVMAHMVYPPKKFDFNGFYGQDAKPFVHFIWDTYTLNAFVNGTYDINDYITDGFGVFFIWNSMYVTGDYGPGLLESGIMGYKVNESWDTSVRAFVDLVHSKDCKVITYLAMPSHSVWNNQDLAVTLNWMRTFQEEYNLDGWYFDNADAGELAEDYDFIRQVRTDIGEHGIIYHHDSVDVWDCDDAEGPYKYRGLRAIMVDAYVNNTFTGETGTIAEIDEPNDPYLRYFTSGYGLSQAYGSHDRKSDAKTAISIAELNRVLGENLNCWSVYGWPNNFKSAYDARKAQYINDPDNFVCDVNWPINATTGWFRYPTDVNHHFVDHDVVITWRTNVNADSEVSYTSNKVWWYTGYPSLPNGPDGTVRDSAKVTDHTITLTGLKSNTPYEFKIRSSNGGQDANEIIWGYVGNFTTLYGVHNLTNGKLYPTIQEAIDDADANHSNEIKVYPGTYYGNVNFKGKAITLQSTDPNERNVVEATIIDANNSGNAVTFSNSEDANSALKGFTIQRGSAGVYCSSGADPIIERCLIRNNTIRGILCTGSGTSPSIVNNIIKNNNYDGIYCSASSAPVIKNNLIYNNKYGIRTLAAGAALIRNNTIVSNTIRGISKSLGTAPTVSNCIIWGCNDDLYGCSATYSCIQDGDSGTGNISSDPCFVDTAGENYHIAYNSPCINAGATGDYTGQTDIDNQNRVIGYAVDIGADESEVDGTGVWNTRTNIRYDAIQDAINAGQTQSGDTIIAYPGTYNENISFGSKVITLRSVALDDWDVVEDTIIDGVSSSAVVTMAGGVILEGFTITGAFGQNAGIASGGSTTSYISNCIIENNYLGITAFSGSPVITNCKIRNNTAHGFLAPTGSSNVEFRNCEIYKNGYGILKVNSGSLAVKNCTIVSNTALGIVAFSSATITNNIIWSNNPNLSGGCSATYSWVGGSDPGFVNAAGENYHLDPNSLCIDAGNNSAVASGDKDIDGDDRIIDGNNDQTATVDKGADEYKP